MILRELLTLLGFKIDDSDLGAYNKRLEGTKKTMSSVKGFAVGLAGALAGVVTGAISKRILDVNADYERLMATLKTVTGSQEAANAKFDELSNIASTTPFQLNEVVDAWAALKAAGFDATSDNIRALGDLASASNKGLGEIVEAMTSARRGSAAMLDNFTAAGIKAKVVKGEIQASARVIGDREFKLTDERSIEQFLVAAGKAKGVAGAMENQMKTLNGLMSNLTDNIWKFFVAIGTNGVRGALSDLLKVMVGGVADGTENLAALIGQTLTPIIRGFTRVLVFLKENARAVAIVFGWIGTAIGAMKIAGIVASMGGLKAILGAVVTAAAPFLLVFAKIALAVGAIMALGLAVEDLWHFFNGGNSAIGDFIKQNEKAEGIIGTIARTAKVLLNGLVRLWTTGWMLAARFWAGVRPILAEFQKFFMQVAGEVMSAIAEAFGGSTSEIGSFEDGVKAVIDFLLQLIEVVFPFLLAAAKFYLRGVINTWKFFFEVAKTGIREVGRLFSGVAERLGLEGGDTFGLLATIAKAWMESTIRTIILVWLAWTWLWDRIGPYAAPVLALLLFLVQGFIVAWVDGVLLMLDVGIFAFNALLNSWKNILRIMSINFFGFFKVISAALEKLGGLLGIDFGNITARFQSFGAGGPGGGNASAQSAIGQAASAAQRQTNVNASVGSVNVEVTQANATPGDIAGAVQTGVGGSLQDVLDSTRNNLAGGPA